MKGLPALIERLALDRTLRGRPDLLMADIDIALPLPDAAALAARLAVGLDLERPASVTGARLPAGVRLGRLAFSPRLRTALATDDVDVPPGLFRVPDTKGALTAFFAERTGLGRSDADPAIAPDVEAALRRFYGLTIGDLAADCLSVRDRDATAYTLLLSLEFDLALARLPGIAAPHPRYPRLARGLLDALLILAELERLHGIVAALVGALAEGSLAMDRKPPNSRDHIRLLLGETSSFSLDDETIKAFLADTPFHVETLLWQVAAGPGSIDFKDELLAMLAGRQETPVALNFPEGRKRLAGMLKDARAMRSNKAGKTMPIGLARYMGLDLIDTATVGLIEIASGIATLGNDRSEKDNRPTRTAAFWTLLIALLTHAAPHAVQDLERLSLRGPARSLHHDADTLDKGEARSRRASEAGGLIDIYLPPADTPVGAARFVPGHWLDRNRHHDWSQRIVGDFRGGAHRGMIDALPAAWKPSIFLRITALKQMLREINDTVTASGDADDDLAAAALAALLPAMTPLTSDPLLHFVLQRHRKDGSGAWAGDRAAALRAVRAEQKPVGAQDVEEPAG